MIFVVNICTTGFSQRVDKEIIVRSTTKGLQYYVHAQTGFESKEAELEFDQTTFVDEDSVRIGITLITEQIIRPDSLIIIHENKDIFTASINSEYTESLKSRWVNRIFLTVSRDEVVQFFELAPPPAIQFTYEGKIFSLNIKERKWNKLCELQQLIYQQIKFNEK